MSDPRIPSGVPQPQGAGEDPLQHYNRLFIIFLQELFASFEKGAYHWSVDDLTTDIIISGDSTVPRESVQKRPAILVTRGPASFSNLSIGSFSAFDQGAAKTTSTDLIATSVAINCISREGLEAGRLAWICGYFIKALKKSLMAAGLHRVGEEIQFSGEGPASPFVTPDPGDMRAVSCMVPFYFQDTWSVEPADKTLLTRIGIALRSDAAYPAPGAVIIRGPGLNGKNVTYDKVVSLNQAVRVDKTGPKPSK